MSQYIQYLVENTMLATLLYALYMLLLNNNTFFSCKRFILLLMLITYSVAPLAEFQVTPNQTFTVAALTVIDDIKVSGANKIVSIHSILFVIALAGSIFFFIRLLLQFGSLLLLKKRSTKLSSGNTQHTIYSMPKAAGPFSFFSLIFLYPPMHTQEEMAKIIEHETIHSYHLHSIDILLYELATCICWFNPFLWLLKKEVKQNLEYITDREMLGMGYSSAGYQYSLLNTSISASHTSITNGFSIAHLKNRITMMNKKKSKKISLVKYALLIPLIAATTFLVSCKNSKTTNSDQPNIEAPQASTLAFNEFEHDFGAINERGDKASAVFSFINNDAEPVIITSVKASCGCTTPEWTKEPIPSGGKGYIKATFNPLGRPGVFNKTITVYTNVGSATLAIKGTVISEN